MCKPFGNVIVLICSLSVDYWILVLSGLPKAHIYMTLVGSHLLISSWSPL